MIANTGTEWICLTVTTEPTSPQKSCILPHAHCENMFSTSSSLIAAEGPLRLAILIYVVRLQLSKRRSDRLITRDHGLMSHRTAIHDVVLFSLASACGQLCVFFCIRRYGALVTAIITTTRKFLSVLLSVLTFGHNLSLSQWIAVFMVFTGIALEIRHKQRSRFSMPQLPDQNRVPSVKSQ
jgi:uncharacterized membrane protein